MKKENIPQNTNNKNSLNSLRLSNQLPIIPFNNILSPTNKTPKKLSTESITLSEIGHKEDQSEKSSFILSNNESKIQNTQNQELDLTLSIFRSPEKNKENNQKAKITKEELNNIPLPIFSCIYCSNDFLSFKHLSMQVIEEKYLYQTSIYDINELDKLLFQGLIDKYDKNSVLLEIVVKNTEHLKNYFNKDQIENFFNSKKFCLLQKINFSEIQNFFLQRIEDSIIRKKKDFYFKGINKIPRNSLNKMSFNSTNSLLLLNNYNALSGSVDNVPGININTPPSNNYNKNNNTVASGTNSYSSLNFNSLSLNNINNNNNGMNNLENIMEKIEKNSEGESDGDEKSYIINMLGLDENLKIKKINKKDINWEEKPFDIWDPKINETDHSVVSDDGCEGYNEIKSGNRIINSGYINLEINKEEVRKAVSHKAIRPIKGIKNNFIKLNKSIGIDNNGNNNINKNQIFSNKYLNGIRNNYGIHLNLNMRKKFQEIRNKSNIINNNISNNPFIYSELNNKENKKLSGIKSFGSTSASSIFVNKRNINKSRDITINYKDLKFNPLFFNINKLNNSVNNLNNANNLVNIINSQNSYVNNNGIIKSKTKETKEKTDSSKEKNKNKINKGKHLLELLKNSRKTKYPKCKSNIVYINLNLNSPNHIAKKNNERKKIFYSGDIIYEKKSPKNLNNVNISNNEIKLPTNNNSTKNFFTKISQNNQNKSLSKFIIKANKNNSNPSINNEVFSQQRKTSQKFYRKYNYFNNSISNINLNKKPKNINLEKKIKEINLNNFKAIKNFINYSPMKVGKRPPTSLDSGLFSYQRQNEGKNIKEKINALINLVSDKNKEGIRKTKSRKKKVESFDCDKKACFNISGESLSSTSINRRTSPLNNRNINTLFNLSKKIINLKENISQNK